MHVVGLSHVSLSLGNRSSMFLTATRFLPPPVLDILNDKELKFVNRAAMITTALTWFFNNLPINSLPLALRPTLLLLQRIAPYLGYIGTFISWTWSTIKSYDKGSGVILTATWLLPIALIPGTWDVHEWPVTPPPPDPTPLSSGSLLSQSQPGSPGTLKSTPAPAAHSPRPSVPPPPASASSTSPKQTPIVPVSSPPLLSSSSTTPASPKRLTVSLANLVAKSQSKKT